MQKVTSAFGIRKGACVWGMGTGTAQKKVFLDWGGGSAESTETGSEPSLLAELAKPGGL